MLDFWSLFTDAHAHLPENPADDEKIAVPATAKILLNSTRPDDFPRVARLAKKFPGQIVPAFGIHPWFAEEWTPETQKLLRNFLSDTPGANIGEIGLDRCRGNSAAQETAFREQLALASEFRVPVTIHIVRAFGKTEEILREFFVAGTLPPFLLHAYSGSPEQAKIFSGFGGAFSAPRKTLPPECFVVPESDRPLR
ncbi:MAG: TatD family hydrolase [Opitutales bacterium]|nr:TatD family hydrolase [Opitutales bacterium]